MVRVLGKNVVEGVVQQDIQEQKGIRKKATNGANAKAVSMKDLPGVPEKVRWRTSNVRKINKEQRNGEMRR